MKKAVFFDIDGTLWDFKMNIPESTKKALKELKVIGKKTAADICTKSGIKDFFKTDKTFKI